MAPRFHLALVEPVIPQNTGNIGRIALAFGLRLHLVGKLGFDLSEHAVRRAGLDYWKHVDLATWESLDALEKALPETRCWLFSSHGKTLVHEAGFREGDTLVFGNEPTGLPRDLVEKAGERSVVIPWLSPEVRSLNLANAVSIGVFEASRRLGFPPVPTSFEEEAAEGEPGRPRRRGAPPKKKLPRSSTKNKVRDQDPRVRCAPS